MKATKRPGRRRSVMAALMNFCLFLVVVGVPLTISAFTISPSNTNRFQNVLMAKKAKRGTNKKPASGGEGFGKPTTSSSATASTPSAISYSGHSGSGTKALRKVANQFDAIRKNHEVSVACRDVYVRSPLHSGTTYWFVGKIACVPPTDESNASDDEETVDAPRFVQTALLLKRIILEYSKDQLRPQAMGGKYASALELWLAPADSEMDVATNKVTLRPVRGSLSDISVENSNILSADSIGYNPEIYVGDERVKGGLRVERDENGVPTKPPFEPNFSQ